MSDIVLKHCPFCGGEAVMETFTTSMEKVPRFRVRCTSKGCRIMLDWEWWSIEEAAKAWNRRDKEVRFRSQLFWHDANVEKPDDDREVLIVQDREFDPSIGRWDGSTWEWPAEYCSGYWTTTSPALLWADLPENPLKDKEVD